MNRLERSAMLEERERHHEPALAVDDRVPPIANRRDEREEAALLLRLAAERHHVERARAAVSGIVGRLGRIFPTVARGPEWSGVAARIAAETREVGIRDADEIGTRHALGRRHVLEELSSRMALPLEHLACAREGR